MSIQSRQTAAPEPETTWPSAQTPFAQFPRSLLSPSDVAAHEIAKWNRVSNPGRETEVLVGGNGLSIPQGQLIDLIEGVACATDAPTALRSIGVAVRTLVGEVDEVFSMLAHPSNPIVETDVHDLAKYWRPLAFRYTFADTRPLGSITLLRLRERSHRQHRVSAIMREHAVVLTHALMAAYALCGPAVERHHAITPGEWESAAQRLGLTPQERRIVARRMTGHPNKEIAAHFGISENGVKRHMNNVYRKTHANGHADLTALCLAEVYEPSSSA